MGDMADDISMNYDEGDIFDMTTQEPNTQPAQPPFDADRMKRIEGYAKWLVENHHNGQRQALAKAYLYQLELNRAQATPPSPAPLRKLLTDVRAEMETLRDGETCDHSVGICWCHYHGLIEQIDEYLSAPSLPSEPLREALEARRVTYKNKLWTEKPEKETAACLRFALEVLDGIESDVAALSAPVPAPVNMDSTNPVTAQPAGSAEQILERMETEGASWPDGEMDSSEEYRQNQLSIIQQIAAITQPVNTGPSAETLTCTIKAEDVAEFKKEWLAATGKPLKVTSAPNEWWPAPGSALKAIWDERQRQQDMEGFTAAHDDKQYGHGKGDLAKAAACYAITGAHEPDNADMSWVVHPEVGTVYRRYWPWDKKWWKPKGGRRDLVRAAALLLAEIERLDRAALAPGAEGGV